MESMAEAGWKQNALIRAIKKKIERCCEPQNLLETDGINHAG
jgi:hypothetical protein